MKHISSTGLCCLAVVGHLIHFADGDPYSAQPLQHELLSLHELLQQTTVHLSASVILVLLFPLGTPTSFTMIESINPEAYLAIASAAQNRVTNYKDNRRAKKSAKLAHVSSANSSNESSLSSTSLDDLLAQEGLELSEAGNVQFCTDSPAHPRAWSKTRKVYDLLLIMSLNFIMGAMSNAGTPIAAYAMETFGVGRVVGLLGFTTV